MSELTKEECVGCKSLLRSLEDRKQIVFDLGAKLEAAELEIGRLCVSGNRIHDGLDEAEQEIKDLENALVDAETEAAMQTARVQQLEDHIRCAPNQNNIDALESRVRELEKAVLAERDAALNLAEIAQANEHRATDAEARVRKLEAALRGVIRVADRKTNEFDAARRALAGNGGTDG